jgi:hypothetical protein
MSRPLCALLFLFLGTVCATAAQVNRSGSIILGGTAQTLAPANLNRLGCVIQPLGTTDFWISLTGTAGAGLGSYVVPAGSVFVCPKPAPTGAITIFSNSTGQPFTAVELTQ